MRLLRSLLCLALLVTPPSAGARQTAAASRSPLFSSYLPLRVGLEAPFAELFSNAQRDPDYSVKGRVSYRDSATSNSVELDKVEVSVRGNTSRWETECSFPKLKLRFQAGAQLDASIFRGAGIVRIGTHCGELPDGQLTRRFGRWANDKAPLREAFVYRLLEAVDVRSLKARPAQIAYVYSDASSEQGAQAGQTIVRNAMFLEDESEAMKRLAAVGELTTEAGENREKGRSRPFEDAQKHFPATDAAKTAFAQAMIGNFDWALKFTPSDTYRSDAVKRLWNILALVRDDGSAFPVMYDFDLSGMVTGTHPWFSRVFYDGFVPSKSHPQVEVLAQLQRTRSLFSRADLDVVRRAFVRNKTAAYQALEDSDIDAYGRTSAEAYLDSFFNAIEADAAFYLPVVTRPNTLLYLDDAKAQEACAPGDPIPVGTPVSAPSEIKRNMVRVAVLDALWHWTGNLRCDAVRTGPVWIDADALSTNYPK